MLRCPVQRVFFLNTAHFSVSASQVKPRNEHTAKTRNIGIIAHIDAGKTTVTERLLYLSGATRFMGDVDSGNTVTDFLEIERERGITVQSAAVSFPWKNHKINLIDTPGHVDFTVEVERCARVLDGVVTVLDGSAGVQAQTRTVWKQASKFGLPATFFINKMDKKGASFTESVDSIEQKLGIKAIPTVIPLANDGSIIGFIDLLRNLELDLQNEKIGWQKVSQGLDLALKGRETLCYSLADCDSQFMSLFLDQFGGDPGKVSDDMLIEAIRRTTLAHSAATVSCGTALRSASSVLPILDQIVDFLPSPCSQIERLAKVMGDDMSALVFKITHDKRKGQLSYLRVYTGQLKNGQMVYNANRAKLVGPVKVFSPQSDELVPADKVSAGGIAVVSGLNSTITADTLTGSESANDKAVKILSTLPHHQEAGVHVEQSSIQFSGIDIPEPVYFCCIEPPTSATIHDFERALDELAVEDPSIRIRKDNTTGQTIVETMGELHLEVIRDRFMRGFGLNVFIGPLQISYRENPATAVEHSATVSDTQGEKAKNHSATVTLKVEPRPAKGAFKRISVDLPPSAMSVRADWQRAISEGCANALHNGPVLGFPVQDVDITLTSLAVSGGRINSAILSAAAHKCVTEALTLAGTHLVEPIMLVEVSLEDGEGAQPLLQELNRRRATVESCESSASGGTKIVALMPLAEMEGLSTAVRVLTSGLGNLHVQVADYSIVNEHDQAAIIAKLRGTQFT